MKVLMLVFTLFQFGCSYPTYYIVKDSYNTYSPTYSPNYASTTTTYQQRPIASSNTPKKATKVRVIVAGSPKWRGE